LEKIEGILELVPIYDLFMLTKPFSEIFSTREEADKAFEFLKNTLEFLGVNDAEDSQFCLSIERGTRIDDSHLLEALKPAGVNSFEDSRYRKIVQVLEEEHLYCSKWLLTLDFKGWRVCAFSNPPESKLLFPFSGEPKITNTKTLEHGGVPEELKNSYYRVSAKYLMKTPWKDATKEASDKALNIYKELEENKSLREQCSYHKEIAEAVFNSDKRQTLLSKGLPDWSDDSDALAAQAPTLVSQEQHEQKLIAPSFEEIKQQVATKGLQINDRLLRRYHLGLETRKFVILSGVSGTGKTWLTQAYAEAISAEYLLVPVAPNWTTNEDLLGYFNPIDQKYHDTEFSRFLTAAETEYKQAQKEGRPAQPYHLVLDEMNLARVEYYFAKFLSAMEVRMREGTARIELGSNEEIGKSKVLLTPNLYFIGTVNVDETTHGFADKVYDRAQLIELTIDEQQLRDYLVKTACNSDCAKVLMEVWKDVHLVAPFAFRVMDEIVTYVKEAEKLSVPWNEALDEQLLQKVLPKFKGADSRVGEALKNFLEIAKKNNLELSLKKAEDMLNKFNEHKFTSYF
jgi:predicted ATPase